MPRPGGSGPGRPVPRSARSSDAHSSSDPCSQGHANPRAAVRTGRALAPALRRATSNAVPDPLHTEGIRAGLSADYSAAWRPGRSRPPQDRYLPGPPRPGSQRAWLASGGGIRGAADQQIRQQLSQCGRRHGVATLDVRLDHASRRAKVDDQQLGLRCGLSPDDLAAQDP